MFCNASPSDKFAPHEARPNLQGVMHKNHVRTFVSATLILILNFQCQVNVVTFLHCCKLHPLSQIAAKPWLNDFGITNVWLPWPNG